MTGINIVSLNRLLEFFANMKTNLKPLRMNDQSENFPKLTSAHWNNHAENPKLLEPIWYQNAISLLFKGRDITGGNRIR